MNATGVSSEVRGIFSIVLIPLLTSYNGFLASDGLGTSVVVVAAALGYTKSTSAVVASRIAAKAGARRLQHEVQLPRSAEA